MKRHFVRPCFDRILVQRAEAVKETAGGFAIPDQSQERPKEGMIVAIGPDVPTSDRVLVDAQELYPLPATGEHDACLLQRNNWIATHQAFNLGDYVLFGQFSGVDVTMDANTDQAATFVLLKQDEIQGVIVALNDGLDDREGVSDLAQSTVNDRQGA